MGNCLCCGIECPPKPKTAADDLLYCGKKCRQNYNDRNRGPKPRTCRTCGETFKPRGNDRHCLPCRGGEIRETSLSQAEILALYRPNPCASCVYGKRSAAAERGYECTIAQAFQCKPWATAILYKERLIGGQTAC